MIDDKDHFRVVQDLELQLTGEVDKQRRGCVHNMLAESSECRSSVTKLGGSVSFCAVFVALLLTCLLRPPAAFGFHLILFCTFDPFLGPCSFYLGHKVGR